jgi:hypothetical protein
MSVIGDGVHTILYKLVNALQETRPIGTSSPAQRKLNTSMMFKTGAPLADLLMFDADPLLGFTLGKFLDPAS